MQNVLQAPEAIPVAPPEVSAVIEFPRGLPGFEGEHQFRMITRKDLSPVAFLQSEASPDLFFTVMPIEAVDAGYELQLTSEDAAYLGVSVDANGAAREALLRLAIVTTPKNGQAHANLLAPVVIHVERNLGVQAVRPDSRYSHCHPIPGVETLSRDGRAS
jgi:flagellar assembly factor FliW